MIDQFLLARLRPAIARARQLRLRLGAAAGLGIAAVLAGVLLMMNHPGARMWLFGAALGLTSLGALLGFAFRPRAGALGRRLEQRYPDLDGRLTTALEQRTDKDGNFSFLQEHLFTETIHHSTQREWLKVIPDASLRWAQAGVIGLIAVFFALWLQLPPAGAGNAFQPAAGGMAQQQADGVEVTPGDTELEKGTSLVLLARFLNTVPASADLVIGESAASERRLPLTRSLNDPVFGGTAPDVKDPFSYHIAWDGGRTRTYSVKVFEYPRLERSDATLTFPEYTKQEPKRIEDTRHTSAVEGTQIDLDLALNKPVASAVLEPRKAKDQKDAPEPVKLEVSPDKASAALRGFVPAQSVRYDLVLTDADGRRSKQPAQFSFDVVPNRVPEMKLASPKGDQKPSAIQELMFEGTAWDDFGVVACGLELTTPGGESVTLEFGKEIPGREKRPFQHLLKFEELKAVPDQLYSWHVWADDIGPDGKVRRTKGDLFFGEVRPFEEIFRQSEGTESEQQQQQDQQQQSGQQGSPAAKLAQLQKQIINATWNLQRSHAAAAEPLSEKEAADVKVIRDSQEQAKAQAQEAAAQGAERPQTAALWQSVLADMDKALEHLDKGAETPSELVAAVGSEQAAYQTLLKLKSREHSVARANRSQQRGQQSQSQGEQQQQQQLNQMDLTQSENRYETQREAQAQQSAERREQAQVINRLKELAERQQDVNEKLKELQTALNEAKSEAEKEEARRQLKRLEEEQRQMLADADELKQRMEQQQNQSQSSEQQQQLDQARQNMQQAAEAAAEGQTGQALASGTRAQEQMEEMREELRKQSAGAFSEELREMRAEAREIARKQEEIAKEMKPAEPDPFNPGAAETPRKAPSLAGGPEDGKIAEALDEQQKRTGDLVQRATELSEQAEPSEPLLSRQIYETARQFSQDDAGAVKEAQQEMIREGRMSRSLFDQLKELQESEQGGRALRLTAEMLQQNQQQQAAKSGERARQGINRLRDGVEKAAESVLGDDTAALRLAESQLEAAAEAMRREMEQQSGQRSRSGNQQPGEEPQRDGQGQLAQQGGQPPQQQDGQPQQGDGRQGGQRPGEGQPQEGRQPGEEPQRDGQGQLAQQGGQPPQQQDGQPPQGNGRQRGQGGQRPGEGQPQEGQQQSEGQQQQVADARPGGQPRPEGSNSGGGQTGPAEGLETNRAARGRRITASDPLTGNGFTDWSDSLREAEEMVDESDLRNSIATARERTRQMRQEMKRGDLKKPDWAVVELEIIKPLVEVRQRLREELARREPDKNLVPVDRDPVPAQFSENVRRYYEQLGKDAPAIAPPAAPR